MNMISLTIKIEDISEGKEKGFKAVIPELGNSIIMADTIPEIFKLIPDVIDVSKKYNIGIFNTDQKKKKLQKLIASIAR